MKNLYQAHIGLTTQCNLRCPHCYSIQERLKNSDFNMSLSTLESILSKLRKWEIFKVIFAYSESLLYKNFFEALEMTHDFGFDIELTTNAIELNKENIEKLEKYGVDKIQISLDYPDNRHDLFRNYPGLFEKVKNALQNLKENGSFRTRILSTQWDDNIDFYKEFQKLANTYDIDVVAFLSAEKFDEKKKKKIKEIIKIMEEDTRFTFHSPFFTPQRCFVGEIIHINPWGAFTLCPLSNQIVANILTLSDNELDKIIQNAPKLPCLHNKEIIHAN